MNNPNSSIETNVNAERDLNIDLIQNKFQRCMIFAFLSVIFLGVFLSFPFLPSSIAKDARSFLIVGWIIYLYIGHTSIMLNKIICPYCNKKYFYGLCSIREFKDKIKTAGNCINCNQKAKIISRYNEPEGIYNNLPWEDWGKNKKK
jgi:ABC-type transport system involved in multi-copper enzyme maturation permease subunit